MKNFMKKIAITLTIVMTFALCFAFVGCDNSCNGEHAFVLTSTTATCTKSGTEYYACANCKETKTETITAYGHSYEKNKCVRCDNALNDLSQFPETYRIEISEKLELIAPYTVESETFIASTRLYKLGLEDVANCENRLKKANDDLDYARNNATIYRPGIGWCTDEKAIYNCEKAVSTAEKDLAEAKTNLKTYKISYEFNCEGYAWYAAIAGIKATDASNSAVNTNVKAISAFVSALNETTTLPTFYQTIISSIYELTGLNISKS